MPDPMTTDHTPTVAGTIKPLLPCPFCGYPLHKRGELISHMHQGNCPIGMQAWPVEHSQHWNRRAAITPAPTDAEPVAWEFRCRTKGSSEWDGWRIGRKPEFLTDLYEAEERPLYAHPAPVPVSTDETAGLVAVVRSRGRNNSLHDIERLCATIEALSAWAPIWAKDGKIWRERAEKAEAERDRLTEELARIADDYHPERGQEGLALAEMREAVAALTQTDRTGDGR